MNGLVFLFYCIQILGALMCEAQNSTATQHTPSSNSAETINQTSNSIPPTNNLMTTRSTTSITTTTRATTLCSQDPSTTTPPPSLLDHLFGKMTCGPVFMVTGGLIIVCTILLVSTLLLAWKVCQLSRRIKALSCDVELVSNTEYRTENGKKNKSKSETEPKETSVLMADLSQTEEETATTKEEEGKVNEDGKTAEEEKKEVGDSTSGEDTPATPEAAAENSSISKPQETATDSQPAKAEEASTSEGDKDVV